MRDRFHIFELDPEGDGVVEGGAAPEPAAEPPAPVADWGGPSQDEWQATQQALSWLVQNVQSLGQPQPPQELPTPAAQEPEFDPFDPNSVQSFIDSRIEQGVQSRIENEFGEFRALLGMVASEKGEALARQQLAQIQQDVGEFDENLAFLISNGMLDQYEPQDALQIAARYANEVEKKIRQSEREKVLAELGQLQAAPPETPISSSSVTEPETIPTGPRRYEEAVQRALARRHAVMPTG